MRTSSKLRSPDHTTVVQRVFTFVSQIPRGHVTTYGDIAHALMLKTPRQVGWVLHRNDDPEHVPCHRVVFADGRLSGSYAFGGEDAQRKWLESEGVPFTKAGRVNLELARWRGKTG